MTTIDQIHDKALCLFNREVLLCVSGLFADQGVEAAEAILGLDADEYIGAHTIQYTVWVCSDGTEFDTEDDADEHVFSIQDSHEEHWVDASHEEEDRSHDVFEHWAVTPWLADRLGDVGEHVVETTIGPVWCRTCTGQSPAIDYCFQAIARDLLTDAEDVAA